MEEITFQMASHAQDYLEVTMERHYTDIKELMTSYQKLILENQIVLEELDMECQEKINEDIPQILKILKQENVKATFFFCGDWISKYPADIKTIYEEGHDIASHGDRHKYMTKLTDKQQQEEIRGVTEKIQGLLGIKIDLFRAPYGDYNESVVKNARRMNYYIIQWNVDSLDWQEPTKEQLIKKVCEHKNLSPGSIILMHTGTKCTKQALKQIIRNIKAKGYQFVPVSRLIYRSNYRIDPTGKQIKL